jgi:hypothetical protein
LDLEVELDRAMAAMCKEIPEPPCPYCGSTLGSYVNYAGWIACINCEGV